ncbi:MAG: site-specific integrase [Desulfovibrio sp.]|nr:site-specific integrase [Desulfovibrio sp.]
MKRIKTKYPGVTYREQERPDGKGMEKVYYIRYRRSGRGSPETEEPCGRETEGMTAAKANGIRAMRINAKELTNKERRQQQKLKEKATGPKTLAELWEVYSKQTSDLPIHAKCDVPFIKHLAPILRRDIASLRTQDIDSLRDRLLRTTCARNPEKSLSPQTVKHALGLLKRMLNFASAQELCDLPSSLRILMPSVDNQKTESMTAEQMAAYWKALDEEADQNEAAILRIALLTGIRKSALLGLEWSDIDFEQETIRLRGVNAKNRKTEYIPMSEAVKKIFQSVECKANPLIWPSPQTGGRRKDFVRMPKRVREKAGLSADFRPMHGLRHAFASHLASSGKVDLYTLQKLLTHGSPQMTQRYAHLADEALKRAANVANDMVKIDS